MTNPTRQPTALSAWHQFWFAPITADRLSGIRKALCIVVAVYFASAMSDVAFWYSAGAPASSTNMATFLRTAELTQDARWMISPLYMIDSLFAETSLAESTLVYQTYLVVGILLAFVVGFSDRLVELNLPPFVRKLLSGSGPGVLLWIWFAGWANRVVLLAGIVEPILSVSLAAIAISPIIGSRASWRCGLSARLLAVQATLIGLLTTATMLASPTWWNGTGAFALVAAEEDRLFAANGTFFQTAWVYESTTAFLVVVLPVGLFLAWRSQTRWLGIVLVYLWCLTVALLSANILYAATLGIIATSIGIGDGIHTTAGAIGAEKLDGGDVDAAH